MMASRVKSIPRWQWLAMTGFALILTGLVLRGRYQFSIVVGKSMLPTLRPGDVLVIDRHAYRYAEPRRGDIVVARWRGERIVKRIVGLPGEELEVKRDVLYIDGIACDEGHDITPGYLDVDRGTLLMGDYATLGDNRSVSPEMAVHPILSEPEILGRVIFSSRGWLSARQTRVRPAGPAVAIAALPLDP